MSDSSWGLVVAFPDGSQSFVHGFETGQIWQMLKAGCAQIERTVHAANEEVILRMCTAEGYEAQFTPSADEFGTEYPTYRVVHIRKVQAAPERPNPHGLRIIEARGEPSMGNIDRTAARDIRGSLCWKADDLITNHFGERWWLKQIENGITECCPEDAPCDRHTTLAGQQDTGETA